MKKLFLLLIVFGSCSKKDCDCPFLGEWCVWDVSKNYCQYYAYAGIDTLFALREFRDNCEFKENSRIYKWSSEDCKKYQITKSDGSIREYEVINLTDSFMYLKAGSINFVYKRL